MSGEAGVTDSETSQAKQEGGETGAQALRGQWVVVAEAGLQQDRSPQGGAAGSPTLGMQSGGGGDNTKQGGEEAGGDSVEVGGPETEAEAEVGLGMMAGLEAEVGGDDTAEESGAEEGSCDLEEAVERSAVQEVAGPEAAGEAGRLMVGQQVEVGSDPEGAGAVREGFWIGNWDFTVQHRNMHRQREREGWKGW